MNTNTLDQKTESIIREWHSAPDSREQDYWYRTLEAAKELQRDEQCVLALLKAIRENAESSTKPESHRQALASLIDHTLLKPEAPVEAIHRLCDEAAEYGFASVCVNPVYVPVCVERLTETDIPVASVVGFPLGAGQPEVKAAEAARAVADGAAELDMVMNIGLLKSGNYTAVADDIAAVVEAAGDTPVKVIIETCLLSDREKVKASLLAVNASAQFVKTSTGFSSGGAIASDVALMRRAVERRCGVKAAGGIRTADDAIAMLRVGATRIGASSGIEIVRGLNSNASS